MGNPDIKLIDGTGEAALQCVTKLASRLLIIERACNTIKINATEMEDAVQELREYIKEKMS